MATYITDQGICLRVTDFSETSQIVAVFTAQHGIVPMIAKGAKRQSKSGASTFSGPLDLLTAGQVVFIAAKQVAELGTMAGWQLTDHRVALRQQYRALQGAMMCAEVTLALLHPNDPHEELFHELNAVLALLPVAKGPRALVAYVKAALGEAGYQPQVEACVECSKPIMPEQEIRYSARAGGAVCGDCHSQGKTLPVSGKILIALGRLPTPRALQATPSDRAAAPAALRTALELLLAQVEAITDRQLRTRRLLDELFI